MPESNASGENGGEILNGGSTEPPLSQEQRVTELLYYGQKAKEKIYFDLLKRVNAGEKLSVSEHRTFQLLGKDLEEYLLSKKQEGSADDEEFGYTAAAKYCGFSRRTLSYHVHRQNITQRPDGVFLKSELDRFLTERGSAVKPDEPDYDTLKAKAELTIKEQRAERERLLLKRLNEQYVDVVVVHKEWAGRVKELSLAMQAWENVLPPLLEGRSKSEMKALIGREVRTMLERFSRTGRWTASEA